MAKSVGQIGLDLVVNQKGFNKQMSGIASLAKKAGAALAGAFAVKKLVQFGAECLELGSDLQEVQNVVDVTFPAMSAQVDAFAKNAAQSFGLSETMAKQYTGTFGAMAKAFGFGESEAYNMATALTGLAGDVASFYNITQDEAYTKLKSVFTGETESLKDLGVVMTQSALDAYALANGYGKTTAQMSEAEKVALRYAFVQNQLSAAAGDFSRTSGSWANQVRILNLQFDSLKATIGQGLINVFTPVIRVVNSLIGRLSVLAEAFRSLTARIFGDAGSGASSSVAAVADSTAVAADASGSMADSTGQTASNLKKANKFLAGFDTIQKLGAEDSSGGSGAGGAASGLGSASSIAGSPADGASTAAGGVAGKLEGLLAYLSSAFAPSFKKVWSDLSGPVTDFGALMGRIFGDITTLAQPLTAYFTGPFIALLTTAFETAGGIFAGLLDSFNMVFGDLWDTIAFPVLQQLLTVGLPIFVDFVTRLIQTAGVLFANLKEIFDAVWSEGVKPALDLICGIFEDLMGVLSEFWYTWAEPIFTNLQEAFNTTKDVLMTAWEEVIRPIWEDFMETVDTLWNEHLKPLVENFLDFVGELVNGALEIYNKFIAPIVQWLTTVLAPIFRSVFHTIFQLVSSIFGGIIDAVDGVITSFKGIIEFITGVFTGDWEKAWQGIQDFFRGIFEAFEGIVKAPINAVIDIINGLISGITAGINAVIRAVNSISFDLPGWLGGGHVGFDLQELTAPQIPKLAQGGYVKANTPQLALIGDNRTQGEIVAPEDKLRELAREAAGIGNDEVIRLLERLLDAVENLDLNVILEFRGQLSALARLLEPYLERERDRKGSRVVKGGTT